MYQYLIDSKLDLLERNFNELKNVKGSWGMGMIQHSCALSFTLRGKTIDSRLVEDRLDVIKKNTSIFSNFRGHNLFYMATLLSFESDPEGSFKAILKNYEELKKDRFSGSDFLSLASIIVYENRDKMDLYTVIERMRYAYEYMKKCHPFLTSHDDYCNACLLAIHSNDLDKDLDHIEEAYNYLNQNGFYKNNDLQAMSQILAFSEDKSMAKCKKAILIRDLLKSNDCKMGSYGNPIIGAMSLLSFDEEMMVKDIKRASGKLKDVKGFGNWRLGQTYRNMLCSSIVASVYGEELTKEHELEKISNNVFLNIIIAIETATTMACVSSAAAASSASS